MQHFETLPDDFGARREPFVRKRLPRRELCHRGLIVEKLAQFGGQIVGFAPVRRDDEDRRVSDLGETTDHERTGGVGGSDRELRIVAMVT